MNVIIVYDFAYVNGGAAGVAIGEALALAEENYPVTFFSAVGPVDSRLLESSVDVICLHQQELKAQLGGPASKIKGAIQGMVNREAVSRLSSLLKGFDPGNTIVHVHGCTLALSPAIFTAIKKHHFKVALTCHDYELNCPTRTYFDYKAGAMCALRGMSAQCVCTNCDKRSRIQKLYRVLREYMLWRFIKGSDLSLIYLSEFNKDIMERDLHFKCNGYIVPNVVNIPPKRRIFPASNHRFLFVGRLNPEKGVELFCEAVTRAGVEADVIGDGELYESMRKKYPNVTFHGWKTQEEMVPIIQKARCFIMSSICYEGSPLTVPELQCGYGLPCIVPTPCGAQLYVDPMQNGMIYKSGDLDELVACIEKCKDDDLIQKFTENCEKIDPEQYSGKAHIRALRKAYDSILANK